MLLLNTETGSQQLNAQHHSDWVNAVAFNQNGKCVVSASRDMTAKIIDTFTGDLLTTYTGHQKPVFDAAFCVVQEQVVSCGADGKIHLWNTKDSGSVSDMSEKPKDDKTVAMMGRGTYPFCRVVVTQDSVFGCSNSGMIDRFAIETQRPGQSYFGDIQPVYAVALDEKSQRLAGGDYAGWVYICNSQGELIPQFIAAPGYRRLIP